MKAINSSPRCLLRYTFSLPLALFSFFPITKGVPGLFHLRWIFFHVPSPERLNSGFAYELCFLDSIHPRLQLIKMYRTILIRMNEVPLMDPKGCSRVARVAKNRGKQGPRAVTWQIVVWKWLWLKRIISFFLFRPCWWFRTRTYIHPSSSQGGDAVVNKITASVFLEYTLPQEGLTQGLVHISRLGGPISRRQSEATRGDTSSRDAT